MKRNSTYCFWFGQPPKVEVGAYNFVSEQVQKVYYICLRNYPKERLSLNWDKTDYGNAELIILPDDENERLKTIYDILNRHETKEHFICGIAGPVANLICPVLKKRHEKFFVVSERPRISFDNPKRCFISTLLYFKYGWWKRILYQKSVKALLPLGQIGVDVFLKLHWNRKMIFRFMYCGEYDSSFEPQKHKAGSVRFLYIGRFGFNHALDVMINAFDRLTKKNWTLDMAGGYGEQKDIIMKWISNHDNVNFIGKINSADVRFVMSQYDCIIVPSRLDGWNCQINESLSIGCPVITHKFSVSSELVKSSGAGIVVDTLNPQEFADALETPLQDDSVIEDWREKAKKYRNRFSKTEVGQYLLDIVDYVNGETKNYPQCPW